MKQSPSNRGLFWLAYTFVFVGFCLVGIARAQTAGVVNLGVTPSSGVGSVVPTITWSTTPAAASCTASGAWTGAKAASGSQAQPAITASSTYTLTCSWSGAIQTATISFVPPTQNTDNTALTNLAGYRLLYGTTPTSFNLSKSYTDPTATSVQIQPASAGTYTGVLRAINAVGVESDNSNTTTFTVTGTSATASNSVTVTVTPKPQPPSSVTATVALANVVPLDSGDGFKRTVVYSITGNGPGVLLGFAKVATPALDGTVVFSYRGASYCKFVLSHPRTGAPNVSWDKGVTPTQESVAPCA